MLTDVFQHLGSVTYVAVVAVLAGTTGWSDFLVGALGNIVGVLFGAILGIPLGFAAERRSTNRQRREAAKIILHSIQQELSTNATSLGQALAESGNTAYPPIRMSAWSWAQTSGQLAAVPQFELQAQIADIYEKLMFLKQLEDTLWNFSFSSAVSMDGFQSMLDVLRESLREESTEVAKDLTSVIGSIEKAQGLL